MSNETQEPSKKHLGGRLGLKIAGSLVAVVALLLVIRATGVHPGREANMAMAPERSPAFSLSYPSSWRRLDQQALVSYGDAFSFLIERRNPGALIGVSVEGLDATGTELRALAGALDQNMSVELESFVKLAEEQLETRGGDPSLLYEYRFLADGRLMIRENLLIVPKGKKIYYIRGWASADDFSSVGQEITDIMTSFREG